MIWMSCWELIKTGLGVGGFYFFFFFNYFMKYKQHLDQKTCGIEETCRH